MLAGKTILVTGASRGIGKAIAEVYAKHSAKVVITGSSLATLQEVQKTIGGDVHCIACDLSEAKNVDALIEEVLTKHQGVDALVNNAGIYEKGNATEGDPDAWARMMRINVDAPMRLTRKLSEKMVAQKSGAVINVASVCGIEPMNGGLAAYAASKHALWGWSRSIYTSLRHHNVKVMAINPGMVSTEMVGQFVPEDFLRERMIQPSDLADVAMLPFTLSAGCVPEEITLRLALPPKP
eukprot:TRINITY_DN1800_c0_g1_i2.p1 TRINITY_DN1800_c0_g1~~TRINITY_DN1800_c0_g1_i2.p1  ORF type:complete len:238 (+),score=101.39 TRINITY_DN1800_c0_g1_i2:49-762(+)